MYSALPVSAASSTPTQRVSRGPRPQVDDHVEDRAPSATDKLSLSMRSCLEMHAAQGAGSVVERQVALGRVGC